MRPNEATCLVVSSVLVADGMMTDDERGFLAALMARLALTDDERARVIDLEGVAAATAVVRDLPTADRQALLELALDAAAADGRLSVHEHATLAALRAALAL
ncbi:MAG: TerB family tellurite resistance protein [Myxococcales bacterium]|nr:TerB family tellurite resistance protein [Myxococcales bacterium]